MRTESISLARFKAMLLMALIVSLLTACHRDQATATEPASAAEKPAAESKEDGVVLDKGQRDSIGLEVTRAKAWSYTPESMGFGVVQSHDVIAQATAELATAEAAVQQSRAALARIDRLAATPGAFGNDARETAERQAITEQAALSLAQRKLSVVLGERSSWNSKDGDRIASELASGAVKLVRATFPFGTTVNVAPKSLRIAPLDLDASLTGWTSRDIWVAPADSSIPGRSYFALLRNASAGEGERVQVWAPAGAPQSGVLVPQSAVVISDGKSWCYVEAEANHFKRKPVDTSLPVADSYFVANGIDVDEPVVTSAAALLLAREINGSPAAD